MSVHRYFLTHNLLKQIYTGHSSQRSRGTRVGTEIGEAPTANCKLKRKVVIIFP